MQLHLLNSFEIDSYRTIEGRSFFEMKEKNSKFLGYAEAVFKELEVKFFLDNIKNMHPKATHHCYAYRLGLDKTQGYRANDDGEPSGTAGKPILGQIDSKQLTNVIIVVVRYYGGTKLGVSGLIESYKTCAALTLDNAVVINKSVCNVYDLQFEYLQLNSVMRLLKNNSYVEIMEQNFDNMCNMLISVHRADCAKLVAELENILGLQVQYLRTQ